jgi:hypothetical protein
MYPCFLKESSICTLVSRSKVVYILKKKVFFEEIQGES